MIDPETSSQDATSVTLKLLDYCQANNWAGYDPYDALNSEIFKALPILDSRIPRLLLTQALKRSPVNIRPLLLIPKTQNPKAMALFLSAFLKLSDLNLVDHQTLIRLMIDQLISLRSESSYWCWGYSFPWQTRTIVVPRATPNLVCTTFVADALLDAFEKFQYQECLDMALSAAEYILHELYWDDGEAGCGFSYPLPTLRSKTHNANLLASALFCRVYKHTAKEKFFGPALKVARYSAARQRPDGSWLYGEAPTQNWVDNFHTGYNLRALKFIDDYLETDEFQECVARGFHFYKAHFFREDGAAKYFHDRTYPIDIHCVAQSIITLLEFRHLDSGNVSLADSVFRWARKYMWNSRGFFYYRVLRTCTIRTSYMRWSQAWMFLALSTLLSEGDKVKKHSDTSSSNVLVKTC